MALNLGSGCIHAPVHSQCGSVPIRRNPIRQNLIRRNLIRRTRFAETLTLTLNPNPNPKP